ncbi:peptidyl-prolyl cis-trans isomerase [Pseudoalteromonas sp. T1lg65]|uniref:peptidylprolyl isomerase n=1 Tax=Pseudoalteromonas sp. T1lg65 TaxID=2077101 RepID=UPI003F79814A
MRVVWLFLASWFSLPCYAVDTVSTNLVKLAQKLYVEQREEISFEEAKQRLLENQFLLVQAKLHNEVILTRQSEVGFSTAYHVNKFTTSALKHWFPVLDKETVSKVALPLTKQQLVKLLGNYPADGKYSEQQIEQWQNVTLSSNPVITVAETMLSQSMQNRFRLHQGDIGLLSAIVSQQQHQVDIFTKAKPLLRKQGLTIAQIRQLATGELLRPEMLAYLGLKDEMHGQRSDYVNHLRAAIPLTAIQQFYRKHRDSFRYVKQVQAQGYYFDKRETAQAFRQLVAQQGWEKALMTYKPTPIWRSNDITLTRADKPMWETQLAFSSEYGSLSPVVRTPHGRWVVLLSHTPQYDYYDATSETVRYQALNALTKQFAQRAYKRAYQQWVAKQKEQVL